MEGKRPIELVQEINFRNTKKIGKLEQGIEYRESGLY